MTVPALEITALSYGYVPDRLALDKVDIAVAAGSFTALLGPNGAGKSTLFALLTRLLAMPPGAVRVFGHDLAVATAPALARMGVVFQQPTLDLDLTVMQNLRSFAALHGIGRKKAGQRGEAVMARLDISDKAATKVRLLNGGHRRRVEIARALLHRPALLLLDEPTVGLDVPSRRQLVTHVHDLCKDEGVAVLWATHLIDEISDSDHVVVLHQGKVKAQGAVPVLRAAHDGASVAALFDHLTGGPPC